jgi:hypothetical protein
MGINKGSEKRIIYTWKWHSWEFKILYLWKSISKSHFLLWKWWVSSREPINVATILKDQDGVNIIEIEIQSDDIFDIPKNFGREDFNPVKFNTWHKNYGDIQTSDDWYITRNLNNFLVRDHKGENY